MLLLNKSNRKRRVFVLIQMAMVMMVALTMFYIYFLIENFKNIHIFDVSCAISSKSNMLDLISWSQKWECIYIFWWNWWINRQIRKRKKWTKFYMQSSIIHNGLFNNYFIKSIYFYFKIVYIHRLFDLRFMFLLMSEKKNEEEAYIMNWELRDA